MTEPSTEGWTDFDGQARKFHYIPADDARALAVLKPCVVEIARLAQLVLKRNHLAARRVKPLAVSALHGRIFALASASEGEE